MDPSRRNAELGLVVDLVTCSLESAALGKDAVRGSLRMRCLVGQITHRDFAAPLRRCLPRFYFAR